MGPGMMLVLVFQRGGLGGYALDARDGIGGIGDQPIALQFGHSTHVERVAEEVVIPVRPPKVWIFYFFANCIDTVPFECNRQDIYVQKSPFTCLRNAFLTMQSFWELTCCFLSDSRSAGDRPLS